MIRPLALLSLLAALASCSSDAQIARHAYTQYRTVRFADPETLLVTACPPVEPNAGDRCRVLRVDLKRRVTTAFEPAPDQSLEDPTLADDGDRIMAVRKGRAKDEHGNIASEIVTFSPADGRASVVYRSPTEIMFPRPAGNGIIFWSRRCEAPVQRYCQQDPMFWQGSGGTALPVERRYGFGQVGTIFRWRGRTYANAMYSRDMMEADTFAFQQRTGYAKFWRLTASRPFGVEPASSVVPVEQGEANGDSDLLMQASDKKGPALYRQHGDGIEWLSSIPETVYPTQTAERIGMDVSPDSRKVVLLVGHRPRDGAAPFYRFTLFDVATRKWQPLVLAPVGPIRAVS